MIFPEVSNSTLAKAKQVWKQMVLTYGRDIVLLNQDDSLRKQVKGFAKRPKIMGLFDRTQASYDQEKYIVMLDADDFPLGDAKPSKFMRAVWDDEEHIFISVTEIDLKGVVFGYRVLVKG